MIAEAVRDGAFELSQLKRDGGYGMDEYVIVVE